MLVGKNGLEHKIKVSGQRCATVCEYSPPSGSSRQMQVDDFLTDLKSHEASPTRIRPMIARAVSNVVGSLLMSMTFDDKEDKTFLRLMELIDEGFKLFTVAMPVNFVPLFRYIPGVNYAYQKIKYNRNETSNFFKGIADEHRSTLDADNIRDVVDAYLIEAKKADRESKLNYFSEAQLIQIMNDLFSAGLETVTSTLEWAVLLLMKYPHVQERVYAEVHSVVGVDRTPELDDLMKMPYTEATMCEILRRSNVIALGNAHNAIR